MGVAWAFSLHGSSGLKRRPVNRERELANNLFRIMHRVKSLVAYSSLSVCLGLLCSCLSASASVSVFSVFLCFNQRSFVDIWAADRPNDNNENKNDDVVLIEVVPRKVSMPSVHRRAKCKLHVFFFLKRPFCRDSAHCFNESIWRYPSPLLSDWMGAKLLKVSSSECTVLIRD